MQLVKLKIENLRNIKSAEIIPGKKINLITGNNGAGKTTLLESIYLLARAKSFRQSQNRNLITEKATELIIYTELQRVDKSKIKIGLSKQKGKTLVHKDGQRVLRLSALAEALPLTIITPNIQRILEEGPDHRRKLLNWGLFHVEQSYGSLVQKYRKTLEQRNVALNRSPAELTVWTKHLASIGEEISSTQSEYIEKWNRYLQQLTDNQDDKFIYTMVMQAGWKRGQTLLESLEESQGLDIERGYTSVGPHRLDIKINVDGKSIKNFFSRGQNKMLAFNLMLAQTIILKKARGYSPVVLIDDFQSELDTERQNLLLNILDKLDSQTFLTSLSKLDNSSTQRENYTMFHVEHGVIKSVK